MSITDNTYKRVQSWKRGKAEKERTVTISFHFINSEYPLEVTRNEVMVVTLSGTGVIHHHMGHQRALLGGAVGAHSTCIRFLPCVGAYVLLQVFHLSGSEGAVRARKGFFPCVNACMFLKVGDDGGLVRAVGTVVGLGRVLAQVFHSLPPALCLWPHL